MTVASRLLRGDDCYRGKPAWLALVDRLRALRRIDGADPYREIGGITEVTAALPDCPALLFDRIKGYPKGLRMLTNATTNVQRAALALGIDPTLGPFDALKAWMEVRGSLELRKPVQVDHAHFLENSDVGDTVDLSKFPVPHWHLKDGGPYIGSGSHPTGTEAVGRYFAFEDDHDACKPFAWLSQFPVISAMTREEARVIEEK